ncbi:MAG: hypothetical protein ABI120_18280 [Gemmatimonadaceae bacterium]
MPSIRFRAAHKHQTSGFKDFYGTQHLVGGVFFLRMRLVLKRGGMAMHIPGMQHE